MKMNKALFSVFAVTLLGVGLVSAYGGWMNSEDHEAIQSAVEARDYESWREAHLAILTENNFNLEVERYESMNQMHDLMYQFREARQNGDEALVADLQAQLEELRPEGFRDMQRAFGGRGQGMYPGQGSCPFSN